MASPQAAMEKLGLQYAGGQDPCASITIGAQYGLTCRRFIRCLVRVWPVGCNPLAGQPACCLLVHAAPALILLHTIAHANPPLPHLTIFCRLAAGNVAAPGGSGARCGRARRPLDSLRQQRAGGLGPAKAVHRRLQPGAAVPPAGKWDGPPCCRDACLPSAQYLPVGLLACTLHVCALHPGDGELLGLLALCCQRQPLLVATWPPTVPARLPAGCGFAEPHAASHGVSGQG